MRSMLRWRGAALMSLRLSAGLRQPNSPELPCLVFCTHFFDNRGVTSRPKYPLLTTHWTMQRRRTSIGNGAGSWIECSSTTNRLPIRSRGPSRSLLKNPRQNESSLIQFFYHESVEARMRGAFTDQGQLFSYISPEARVRTDHPLRKIRELVRDVLGELNRSLSRLYACEGRPSIPPEQLLSALLLQVFYGIRSERQLMEQLDYNLLYRWFVGLS